MNHNGKNSQINLAYLVQRGNWPFLNLMKGGQTWIRFDNSTPLDLSKHDDNGYMHTVYGTGVYCVMQAPLPAERSGNWVATWDGGGTISFGQSGSVISGSNASRRWVFTTTDGQIILRVTGVTADGSDYPTNIRVFHEDDEARIDAGEIWNPDFLAVAGQYGVLRNMNAVNVNTSFVAKSANVTPETHYTYGGEYFPVALYGGVTANSGDNYTATLSSFSLVDKAQVIVKWNATASGSTPTLDVSGTGAKTIVDAYCDPIASSSRRPTINETNLLMYDATLDKYILSRTGTGSISRLSHLPDRLFLDLCKTIGAYPWFCIPMLALDPLTDYVDDLIALCKTELAGTNLVPRFEPANEVWNSAAFFLPTYYGWAKEVARGYADFSHNEWYGRVASKLFQKVSTEYANDRTKYQAICAVQTYGGTSAMNARLESARLVAETSSAQAMKNWATHLAITGYFAPKYSLYREQGTRAAVYEYDAGDADTKARILSQYCTPTSRNTSVAGFDSLNDIYDDVNGVCTTYSLTLTQYEGGYSNEPVTVDPIYNISGISKAASAVITFDSAWTHQFEVGDVVLVGLSTGGSQVQGMTEIRNATPTVTAVDYGANTITVDIDSSAYTTYTSLGGVSLTGYGAKLNAFAKQLRYADAVIYETFQNLSHFVTVAGGEFPSEYEFAGNGSSNSAFVWTVLDSIYDLTTARYKGLLAYNAGNVCIARCK